MTDAVTYHDSCSGLRELGVKQQPRRLLASVGGLKLSEMKSPEVCCGFGGTFCVKYPEISNAMVGEKSADIAATGADTLLAGDLGCLMNMAGKLQRQGSAVRVRHVAEVLAGMGDQAPIGEPDPGKRLMESTAHDFNDNVDTALADPNLQDSLAKLKVGFSERRRQAAERLPEFEALRDRARDIKNHALANLDFYLEEFERKVTALGGHVHWAPTAEDARRIIGELCQSMGARTVAKSKSMVAEEIALNDHLEALGIAPIETDLGEYIIQLRHEPPSHIIAPAVHLTKDQVADTFLEHHSRLGFTKRLTERNDLVAEARYVLRQKFLDADVGLTGANFLVAETGSSMLVTNEGNADLSNTLPRMHIVLASIEKVIPTLEDAAVLLRVLARSATGQESSAYTTLNTGPKRPGDLDGPELYHVVILDNGRSAVLGTEMQDMLRCIRCGACMNHCPVYGAIGGHAYGWVYPGPIGAVLTPQLIGVEEAGNLPNASTFCGRCESVCPVRIPLPGLMRHWREREFERHLTPKAVRQGLAAVELPGPPAAPLSPPHRTRQPRARAVRPRPGPLSIPAAGRRLDALPRLPRAAAGRHVPCSVARQAVMTEARSQILNGIRRSLQRGELSGDALKTVEARLAQPPRGPAVARASPGAAGKGRAVLPMGRGQQCNRGPRGAGRGGRRSLVLSRAQQPAGRGRDGALAAARRL